MTLMETLGNFTILLYCLYGRSVLLLKTAPCWRTATPSPTLSFHLFPPLFALAPSRQQFLASYFPFRKIFHCEASFPAISPFEELFRVSRKEVILSASFSNPWACLPTDRPTEPRISYQAKPKLRRLLVGSLISSETNFLLLLILVDAFKGSFSLTKRRRRRHHHRRLNVQAEKMESTKRCVKYPLIEMGGNERREEIYVRLVGGQTESFGLSIARSTTAKTVRVMKTENRRQLRAEPGWVDHRHRNGTEEEPTTVSIPVVNSSTSRKNKLFIT